MRWAHSAVDYLAAAVGHDMMGEAGLIGMSVQHGVLEKGLRLLSLNLSDRKTDEYE